MPSGQTRIHVDDEVFFIAAKADINKVMSELRRLEKPYKRIMIAGGGKVGFSLAKMEARIAIGMFLKNFPNYNLISKPRWSRRIRFRGLTHLHARLER